MKRGDFFRKLQNKCFSDSEIERTKEIIKSFNIASGEQLTKLFCKKDAFPLADVSQKNTIVSIEVKDNFFSHCVSLSGYTYQGGLNHTDFNNPITSR